MKPCPFYRPAILFLVAGIGLPTSLGAAAQTDQAARKPTAESASTSTMAKVDINTATPAELEKLPGVGTDFANAIIASRPFKSVDDLARVSGIGPEKMKILRDRIVASPVSPTASGPDASATAAESKPSTVNEGRAIAGKEPAERPHRSPTGTGGRVDLNTATKEQLAAISGIGPEKAQAVIDARPFTSTEEIRRVTGFTDENYQAIKDKVVVNKR